MTLRTKALQAWVLENQPRGEDTMGGMCLRYERWALRNATLPNLAETIYFSFVSPEDMHTMLWELGDYIRTEVGAMPPPPSPSENSSEAPSDVSAETLERCSALLTVSPPPAR